MEMTQVIGYMLQHIWVLRVDAPSSHRFHSLVKWLYMMGQIITFSYIFKWENLIASLR